MIENTHDLIQEIETVRERCDAPYIAIAIEGCGPSIEDIFAEIRVLALVATRESLNPDSKIFKSGLGGIRPTRHILNQALLFHTNENISLINPPAPAREGDSSLYYTPRLKQLVVGEPASTYLTSLYSQPETAVHVGNIETLIAIKNSWARQTVKHCTDAANRRDHELAIELAFSSLGMLDRQDPARYGVICRLGKLGFDPDRLFKTHRIKDTMGIDEERFRHDIAQIH